MQNPAKTDAVALDPAKEKFSFRIAALTLCGVGFIRKAPGTWGTLAALIFSSLLNFFLQNFFPEEKISFLDQAILSVLIILGSIGTIFFLREKPEGWEDDPGFVVLDEAVGIWLTIFILNIFHLNGIIFLTIGFILFRIFDIWKPYPISKLNERKGGFFVLMDDVVAGIFAALFIILATKIYFFIA